jgi:hypothetical protein
MRHCSDQLNYGHQNWVAMFSLVSMRKVTWTLDIVIFVRGQGTNTWYFGLMHIAEEDRMRLPPGHLHDSTCYNRRAWSDTQSGPIRLVLVAPPALFPCFLIPFTVMNENTDYFGFLGCFNTASPRVSAQIKTHSLNLISESQDFTQPPKAHGSIGKSQKYGNSVVDCGHLK